MSEHGVHCGLSGLYIPDYPYTEVVGFKMADSSPRGDFLFVPQSFPVRGIHDGWGGIKDHKQEKEVLEADGYNFICLASVWDELPSLFKKCENYDKRTRPLKEEILEAHDAYIKNINYFKSFPDDEYYKKQLANADMYLWLAISGVTGNGYGPLKKLDNFGFYEKGRVIEENKFGKFITEIHELVKQGSQYPNFDSVCESLEVLTYAYSTEYFRGRPAMPHQFSRATQYSDLKLEVEWFAFVSKTCTNQRNKRLKKKLV